MCTSSPVPVSDQPQATALPVFRIIDLSVEGVVR